MLEAYLRIMAMALAVPLLLLPLERLAPAEAGHPALRRLFNLLYGPLILAFALLALTAAAPAYSLVQSRVGGGLLPFFRGADMPAVALFALAYAFAWDVAQYWLHRLQHKIPFLWETHRFHHDETALSAAAYHRGHFLGIVGVVLFNLPVIALFGTRAPHAVAAFLLFPFWGYLTHANLRLGFGPLTPWLSGPQWHRIHHSALPEHRDRNFSTLFPIVDIAFGTYYRPRAGEYPPTGTGEQRVGNLRGATVQPFVAWWAMLGKNGCWSPNMRKFAAPRATLRNSFVRTIEFFRETRGWRRTADDAASASMEARDGNKKTAENWRARQDSNLRPQA